MSLAAVDDLVDPLVAEADRSSDCADGDAIIVRGRDRIQQPRPCVRGLRCGIDEFRVPVRHLVGFHHPVVVEGVALCEKLAYERAVDRQTPHSIILRDDDFSVVAIHAEGVGVDAGGCDLHV